jgi:hypothetical protein
VTEQATAKQGQQVPQGSQSLSNSSTSDAPAVLNDAITAGIWGKMGLNGYFAWQQSSGPNVRFTPKSRHS